MEQRLAIRADVLASLGAGTEVAEEVLRYNENHFDHAAIAGSRFPLDDESFVATWRQYARETEETGDITPLAKYLVQLQFPIEARMSETANYIAATRRGLKMEGMKLGLGLPLREPRRCRLGIHPTAAGSMPLLLTGNREDFVSLVQAFTHRNEPHPVPDSMGACMVAGYNNWHRIAVLRDHFQVSRSANASWAEEFQRIKAQKELYQDRFIILSTGPYSAVRASALGLGHQEWLELSAVIRREHECTHYFTQRLFSSMRNSLLDELIADYMGISVATGRFRADWLLRFFGLESFPKYREDGRLQNYRGAPPLSGHAFALLQKLVVAAATNLEDFDRCHVPEFQHSRLGPALLKTLTRLTVEELACNKTQEMLGDSFAEAVKGMSGSDLADGLKASHESSGTANQTTKVTY
ncbi:MAG TPA: hypothetical protein VI636_08525 [Candidatus Angelobacter sp.]